MFSETWFDLLLQGGFTIFILLICSILSIKILIEKFIVFYGIKENVIEDLKSKVIPLLKSKDYENAQNVCRDASWTFLSFKIKSPISNIYKNIIEHSSLQKEELTEIALTKMDIEITKLEKGLGILATLGSISPFIGLFGTVIGIIKSFHALSLTDSSNYAKVMSGIAEALIATAAGLFVAIPAVMFYNYFIKRIKLSIPVFQESVQDVIRILKSN